MKRNWLYIFIIGILGTMFLPGCNKPKTIPDKHMKEIFREVYLSNAYISNMVPAYPAYKDSTDIYNPILEKHGYTYDDLIYTMENFSKRKSSRMSDIVNDVLEQLEKETEVYRKEVAVVDTIEARAVRMFTRVVYERDSIVVNKLKDTADLRITIPVDAQGAYEVKYFYSIDSLDKNKSLRSTFDAIEKNGNRRFGTTNWMMARSRNTGYTSKINTIKRDSVLVLSFGNYTKVSTRPNIRIDSLIVTYIPPTSVALDSFSSLMKPVKLPQVLKNEQAKEDSIALHIDAGWAVPKRVDND